MSTTALACRTRSDSEMKAERASGTGTRWASRSRLSAVSYDIGLSYSMCSYSRGCALSARSHVTSTETPMRKHPSRPVFCALLLAAAILSPSCASHGTAPDTSLGLSVVIEACADLDLNARLLDLDGDLHVHGSVRAKGMRATVPGHVDVVVRTADGTEWASGQASYRLRLRSGPRRGSSYSAFDATFEGQPPAGSTVMLRHHDEPHGER